MRTQSFEKTIERTQSLISSASENVCLARDLREACRELRYANFDFREFLSEQRLRVQAMAQSMHERWVGREVTPERH